MATKKSIGLKELEKDKEKVESDIQRLQTDLIGAQYVYRYLLQKIKSLRSNGNGT